jgi:hypothetical protein
MEEWRYSIKYFLCALNRGEYSVSRREERTPSTRFIGAGLSKDHCKEEKILLPLQ